MHEAVSGHLNLLNNVLLGLVGSFLASWLYIGTDTIIISWVLEKISSGPDLAQSNIRDYFFV